MKIEKIDFLMPIRSQYGALHYFTKKISEAFARKGLKCRLIDKNDFFSTPLIDPPDLIFGLNGVPANEHGQLLSDLSPLPYFSYLIDPPYRFFQIFNNPQVSIGSDDAYGCYFLQQLHFDRVHFFPHGADRALVEEAPQKKIYDVVMLSTFIDYEAIRTHWRASLPKVLCQILDDTIDLTFSDDHTSFMEAFQTMFRDRLGLDPLETCTLEELSTILSALEGYIKGKERVDLILSINDAQILLFDGHAAENSGWEKVLKDKHPNIQLHPPVDYEEGLEMMKRAKIVLNAFSKNKEGAHDRIFNGLLAGALVLTNENIFMKKYFKDQENILFYHPSDFSGVNEKINKYLSDNSLREAAIEKGRHEVLLRHTWDHRVEELLASDLFS